MTIEQKIGNLSFTPATAHRDLLASPTAAAAARLPKLLVSPIDPALSDTEAFCAHYGIGLSMTGNCVILEAHKGQRRWDAAVMIAGDARADVNKVVRKHLGARKVSFAPESEAVERTGMEYGGITPVGLPADWPILVDEQLAALDWVLIGSGIRRSKLLISGKDLATLPNATVMALRQEA